MHFVLLLLLKMFGNGQYIYEHYSPSNIFVGQNSLGKHIIRPYLILPNILFKYKIMPTLKTSFNDVYNRK